MGPHREQQYAVRADGEAAAGAQGAGQVHGVRPTRELRSLPARLESYKYGSNQVQVEYIDALTRTRCRPKSTRSTHPARSSSSMGRTERASTDSEQDLTNALIKLLNPTQKKVYFLSGHGEKDPANSERSGYSGIGDALKRDNYQFDKLVLAQTNEIRPTPPCSWSPDRAPICSSRKVPPRGVPRQEARASCSSCSTRPRTSSSRRRCRRITGLLEGVGHQRHRVRRRRSQRTHLGRHRAGSAPPYPSHAITITSASSRCFRSRARSLQPRRPEGRTRANRSCRQPRGAGRETNLPSLEDRRSWRPNPRRATWPARSRSGWPRVSPAHAREAGRPPPPT